MNEDFEQLLRGMQPSSPSPRLKDGIRGGLARRQRPWLAPVLAGLVLLAGGGVLIVRPRPPEAAAFSYQEVPTGTETVVIFQPNGPPLKVTKTASVAQCQWKNSREGSEGVTAFPRELIVISELEIQ